MNQQYPNPPFEQTNRPEPKLPDPFANPGIIPARSDQYLYSMATSPTAWKSAPAAVRFAVWVWAISVIASLAGVALFLVLFVLGLNLAILGGH